MKLLSVPLVSSVLTPSTTMHQHLRILQRILYELNNRLSRHNDGHRAAGYKIAKNDNTARGYHARLFVDGHCSADGHSIMPLFGRWSLLHTIVRSMDTATCHFSVDGHCYMQFFG